MKTAISLWIFLLCCAAMGLAEETPLAAPEASIPSAEEIAKLIKQLNANDFTSREQASRRLTEIGAPALPALNEALLSKELELTARAAKIIEAIDKPKALLNVMVSAAAETYENSLQAFARGLCDVEPIYVWSKRWMEAYCAANGKPSGRLEALEAHAARMQKLQVSVEQRFKAGQVTKRDLSASKYYCADAERALLLAKAQQDR